MLPLQENGLAGRCLCGQYFDVAHPGIVEDFGDYTNLKNLSSTEPIAKTDKGIQVASDVGKFSLPG